jgi:hypothetical protein
MTEKHTEESVLAMLARYLDAGSHKGFDGKEHPELKNPDLVAIFAKIRPSGEKKAALSDALESTKEIIYIT